MFNPISFADAAVGSRTVHLRLIETTDLHLHLLPFDYFTDSPSPGVGLLAAAELIEAARAEAENALLFDNGDFLQGTAMGDYLAYQRKGTAGDLHPAINAMNALRYDAITLGNHEFNYGIDFLMSTLSGAACPVVSANLATRKGAAPRGDRTLVRPYVLLDRMLTDASGARHPIRIGVIGFAPPQVIDWDRHHLHNAVHSRDIVETARAWVPEMREAGADVIVALAHTGIGAAQHGDGMENAAIPLARVPGIDALMLGHNHMVFPSPIFTGTAGVDAQTGTIAGKPAVMSGFWGSHIGLIDLLLSHEGGRWQVLGTHTQTRSVAAAAATAGQAAPAVTPGRQKVSASSPATVVERLAASIASVHEDTRNAIRRPVARTDVALHSYFAHLGETQALSLIADAQRRHVTARLADTGLRALPVLSAVAPFKCGGLSGPGHFTDIPPGPLALRHIADLYSFPNAIAALRVTAAEVIAWLERSASAFNRLRPGGEDVLLRDARVPGYNFEVIDGLEVEFDLSQPARYGPDGTIINAVAERVRKAAFDGKPLDPAQEFILCTNSYRASGAGGFPATGAGRCALQDGTITRDLIRDHLEQIQTVTSGAAPPVRFTPLPGTHALFETGPGAAAHLDQIARFQPERRGLSSAGFMRLRLDWSSA